MMMMMMITETNPTSSEDCAQHFCSKNNYADLAGSVTRWLDYLLNIWPLKTIRPIENKSCQTINFPLKAIIR